MISGMVWTGQLDSHAYTSEDWHRTWKWWFGRWFSSSRGPVFSGSMLIFRGVSIKRCSKPPPPWSFNSKFFFPNTSWVGRFSPLLGGFVVTFQGPKGRPGNQLWAWLYFPKGNERHQFWRHMAWFETKMNFKSDVTATSTCRMRT